jgi:CRISPR/Cas system endoribonuclease Cas6 (RAMP superfamily)
MWLRPQPNLNIVARGVKHRNPRPTLQRGALMWKKTNDNPSRAFYSTSGFNMYYLKMSCALVSISVLDISLSSFILHNVLCESWKKKKKDLDFKTTNPVMIHLKNVKTEKNKL